MTLFHSPSVQSPAAYSNQNLAGSQLAARMAGTASAAQRANLRTAIQDALYQYRIHPAETAVGLVEANLNFGTRVGEVDRYGTNTVPGTTSMATAWQRAINVAKNSGISVKWGMTAPYLIDATLDCTAQPGSQNLGITIEAHGQCEAITSGAPLRPGVIFKLVNGAGVHGFDCTGNSGMVWDGGSYGTDSSISYPQTIFFLARNSDKNSQVVHMKNVRFIGKASKAVYYNYGSENSVCQGCYFENDAPDANTATRVYTNNNIAGLISNLTTIATGGVSATVHDDIGCSDFNFGGTATSDCIVLEQVDGFHKYGGWGYSASATVNGRALIQVDGTNGASNFCTIYGVQGEPAVKLQNYGLHFSNHARTHVGWVVDGCKFTNALLAIWAEVAATLDTFTVRGLTGGSGGGIAITGTLQNSAAFDYGNQTTAIGTSSNNCLRGDTTVLTITTRSNDYLIDTGTASKTWNPALGSMTHGGVTSFTSKKFLVSGNRAFFSVVITDTVSLTATLAQTLAGLPFAAAAPSSDVTVANVTTKAAIGTGYIDGNATVINMPAFTVGVSVSVCVSGSYFIA